MSIGICYCVPIFALHTFHVRAIGHLHLSKLIHRSCRGPRGPNCPASTCPAAIAMPLPSHSIAYACNANLPIGFLLPPTHSRRHLHTLPCQGSIRADICHSVMVLHVSNNLLIFKGPSGVLRQTSRPCLAPGRSCMTSRVNHLRRSDQ